MKLLGTAWGLSLHLDLGKRSGECLWVVSKGVDPAHLRFSAKPGDLALGVVAVTLLSRGDGLRQSDFSAQECLSLAIAERIERADGSVTGKQRLRLRNQAIVEHLRGTCVDARIERWARRIQPDPKQTEAGERFTTVGKLCGHGSPGSKSDLKGANELGCVVGVDARGSDGIEALEQAMKPALAPLRLSPDKALAQIVVALRTGKETLHQGTQIESGAAGEDGNGTARGDGTHGGASLAGIVAGREVRVGIGDIEEVMRHKRALGCGGLG